MRCARGQPRALPARTASRRDVNKCVCVWACVCARDGARGQPVLCLPVLIYWLPLLRALVPVSVSDCVLELLGVSVSMDHFTQTR